ncbi:MAG: STAS domain-containing protein [SAR324 cluster bacterium]|nr:STAS domain-containing protein [SAR324 cluster bacterium]
MNVTHYEQNKLCIISFEGNLTNSTVGVCNEYLRPILADMEKKKQIAGLLMNLSKVNLIDSAGIGFICAKFVRMKKQGKKFGLCNLKETLKTTFSMTGLDSNITIYSTTMEGLHHMGIS